MKKIKMFPMVGEFAEDKDKARKIRLTEIEPGLDVGEEIELDFEEVVSMTQSFAHAMLSELFRRRGGEVLDKISFKNCNETVKGIINIVVDYMQI